MLQLLQYTVKKGTIASEMKETADSEAERRENIVAVNPTQLL